MAKKTEKKVEKKVEKRPVGRPPTWTNPDVLAKLIDQYFKNQPHPTMAGLAESLDISRASLYQYAEKDEFIDTIKKARQRIELIYEDLLIYGTAPTGVIFALKNTGWKDRTDMTTDDKPLPAPIYGGKAKDSI